MGAFVYMDYREVSRYAAIYDVPKQNTMGLPASSVSLDGSQFKFEMNINPAKFVATVDAAKSTITGTWTQGDHDQPLVLSRQSKSR